MRNYILHIVFLWLISASLHAQSKKEIENLQKEAVIEVYENPDKAIAMCHKILESKIDIGTKITVWITISDAYSSKRDYRKSLESAIRAKALAEQTDNAVIKAKILTKMAVQYQQLKIYDKAIQNLDEVLVVVQDYPHKDSIRYLLGTNFTIRGFIYKEQFNCDIAIDYFNKGIAEYKKRDSKMIYANLSIVAYNKGNCYIQLSDYEAAKSSFTESVNCAKAVDAKSLLAFAKKGLAEVYTLEGKYEQAISELVQAEEISDGVGDLVLNQGIYKGLSENYLAVNQWANYRKFQQLHLETQQRLRESERKSVSDSIKEQGKIQDEKRKATQSGYVMAVLVVIILIFVAIIAFTFLHKKGLRQLDVLQKRLKDLQQNTTNAGSERV